MDRCRRACMLLLAAALCGCPATTPDPPPATGGDVATSPGAQRGIVARPEVSLWAKRGGTGAHVADVHQGVQVLIQEITEKGWSRVSTLGEVRVQGWVRSDSLGCRITEKTPLSTERGTPADASTPVARTGATVRVLEQNEGWMRVESAPERFTWYETGGKHDPVLEHVEFTGYVVQGWIPVTSCSPQQKPYYPRAPEDGTAAVLEKATFIHSEPGGLASQLPGKALPLTRWVILETDGLWTRGRTDGQVWVYGWVPTSAVAPPPLTNPLYKLVQHEMKDYEVLGDQVLTDEKGKTVTILEAGQDVSKVGQDLRGCQVKTPPPVVVKGFVPCENLRDLSTIPEAAIEFGVIDGGAAPPVRGPLPNPVPVK